jgi:hypothetical protein
MVMAVIGAVFASRSCNSLYQGLAVPTDGVAVTVPGVPPSVMVNATVALRLVEPDVPVRVTLAVPSVAELDAVNVAITELPVVPPVGLNATVTPPGSPLAAKLTAFVKLVRVIDTVDVPLAPRATESVPGDAATVKSLVGVFETVSDTDVVRVSEPAVAVSVITAAPSVAELEAVNVAVTELPVVAPDGLNATETPEGNPDALMVTAPVKLVREMPTVVDAEAPRTTDSEAGEAATL